MLIDSNLRIEQRLGIAGEDFFGEGKSKNWVLIVIIMLFSTFIIEYVKFQMHRLKSELFSIASGPLNQLRNFELLALSCNNFF